MRRVQMSVVLVLSCLLLTPCASRAQDGQAAPESPPRPPDIPPGEDRIESLAQGARASFQGMLLDTDTAIRWTNRLRWYQAEFQLRLRAEDRTLAAVRASHVTELRIVEESYQREIQGLRSDLQEAANQLARAQDRPWYDTVTFGFVAGIVVMVIVAALGVGAFVAISN